MVKYICIIYLAEPQCRMAYCRIQGGNIYFSCYVVIRQSFNPAILLFLRQLTRVSSRIRFFFLILKEFLFMRTTSKVSPSKAGDSLLV